MGGVNSALDVINKATTFSAEILRAQRIDFVIGDEAGDRNCICCNLNTTFNWELTTQEHCGLDEDVSAIFTNEKIVQEICRCLEFEDLLSIRIINAFWNKQACACLKQRRCHVTRLSSEGDACQFLEVLKHVTEWHPFGDLILDLWDISLESILNISRESYWVKGLSISGTSSGPTSLEYFILKEISSKVAVILHGVRALESLSIKIDYEISITGILELILPHQMPRLKSLLINIQHQGFGYRGYFLEDVICRSPALTSLGIILPEGGNENFLENLSSLRRESNLTSISLATPISLTNIQSLKTRVGFTALRIRARDFETEELRKGIYTFLESQSETLLTLGITVESNNSCILPQWNLPTLPKLEVLSILIIGSKSPVFSPFHHLQFPALNSFAFVHSSAKLELFREGIFPKLTAVGFSGKNGPLDQNLATFLPNLQHVTLCGVARQHVATILTQFTGLRELVLIFEGGEPDIWPEMTGGVPRSWEDFFEDVFGELEISDSLDEEWDALTSMYKMNPNDGPSEILFRDSLEGLDAMTDKYYGRGEGVTPSLANMKCLEYLKFIGWNIGAISGLVHMSSNRKCIPLSNLHLQIPSSCKLPHGSLDLLRTYHKKVLVNYIS